MLALALLLQTAAPPPLATGEEVVVVARRGKCSVRVADRILSDREFMARAAEWAAGTPVRVRVADRSDYQCMARIVFKLSERGVRNVEFVPPGAPAPR